MSGPRTLFAKLWDAHEVVAETAHTPAVLYVDLHLIHEVTSPQAFQELAARGLTVRRPDLTVATADHSTPTLPRRANGAVVYGDPAAAAQVDRLTQNCKKHGIVLYGLGDAHHGIVHVIGPELGLTQPGMTVVCGDSHTATHGAFGALAFGIGTSEVGHVFATQSLLQRRAKTFRIRIDGQLRPGVTAKDLILALIAAVGTDGGSGHVVEFCGAAVRSLSMEGRMTLCNMAIEAGARAGLVEPDDTTFQYLAGRKHVPVGPDFEKAVARWRSLASDPDARFDKEFVFNASTLEPMITYGTTPAMAIAVGGTVPIPSDQSQSKAVRYMAVDPGEPLLGREVNVVFIGSCTNGRLSDLRAAAEILRGRHVAKGLRALVVPGSQAVKLAAEAEGLDQVFLAAGCDWREPGCSMCIAMNGDVLAPGEYAVATSNRNFEGRQGPGGRTFLASPLTAAAAAVMGRITDPRNLMR